MKRFILIVLSVLMLFSVACDKKEPDRLADGSVRFTKENFPRVCVTPYSQRLGEYFASAVLGVSSEEAKLSITVCNTTDECYLKLIAGECDIVIAHGYGKAVTAELDKTALELTTTELKRDALVFMGNGLNPDGLTKEQIASVYKGEVSNWNALGGSDASVTLFGAKSGTAAQNAFEQYIAADVTVPFVYKTITTADGEFEAEIDFDNRKGAIGYTLFSLAGNFNNGTITPVKIDNVTPDAETIKNGQYPLSFPVGVTIRSSEAAGNNVRVLYDWLLSNQGKTSLGIELQ